jgi:hypothetical protein
VALLGIESLPSELLKVVRALPRVADRLDAIGTSTDELPKMRAGIDALGAGIDRLVELMDRLLASIETLDGNVGSL